MGKQINYYMGYQDFLSVAQAALDCGCIIYRHAYEDGRWNLIGGTTLDIVKPNCRRYYFHIPALGSFDRKLVSDNAYLSDDSLFCVIEAGFTIPGKQEMDKNRLYIVTGRYTDDGCWVSCPDMLTKVYNKLVWVVKKTAPYTEFEHFVVNPMYEGEKFKSKEYISPEFYELVQSKDYKLG
ncbi:MAG: hypothetical protein K2H37_14470 [Lachnospiraceae bacterium]|nr:hypothetical protein [Lachnospiraceae bacterium]